MMEINLKTDHTLSGHFHHWATKADILNNILLKIFF